MRSLSRAVRRKRHLGQGRRLDLLAILSRQEESVRRTPTPTREGYRNEAEKELSHSGLTRRQAFVYGGVAIPSHLDCALKRIPPEL